MKKVVHYTKIHQMMMGIGAIIDTLDHPDAKISNTCQVMTSAVVHYDEKTGVFETKNTEYRPYSHRWIN